MACLVILLLFALIQWLAVPDEEEGKHISSFLVVRKLEAVGNSMHTLQKPEVATECTTDLLGSMFSGVSADSCVLLLERSDLLCWNEYCCLT